MENVYGSMITTDFSVRVNVNNTSMHFTGQGKGEASTGEVSVAIETRDRLPNGFNPGLLTFALITGQPDISATVAGAENLFQLVRGEYHGIRHLDLGDCGGLKADYRVSPLVDGRRLAEFDITGTTNAPEVSSLVPSFEVWVPEGPGIIRGHFSMVWKTRADGYMKGEIESEYRLPTDRILPQVHYRRIVFSLDVQQQGLRQAETITLFTPEPVGVPVLA
jgi:hypothetical protein